MSEYALLRSLDPHHQRVGYLGVVAVLGGRELDTREALTARLEDMLFEKIYADDPRFEILLDRTDPLFRSELREKAIQRALNPDENPASLLAEPTKEKGWLDLCEFWLADASMPSHLGHVSREKIHRVIEFSRWTGVILPTYDLSENGFALHLLLKAAAKNADDPRLFNYLNPQVRPALPAMYLRLLLTSELLFPFLIREAVDRFETGKRLATRGKDGLLRHAVERMINATEKGVHPEDMLAAREIREFQQSLLKSLSTEENYLRPRMELLVDLGMIFRQPEAKTKKTEFAWTITDRTQTLASEWAHLETNPDSLEDYLDRTYFKSLARVHGGVTYKAISSEPEKLLWFLRAMQLIGREFGFTPGRSAALLACLLAWESNRILEVGDVFDAVFSAAKSEIGRYLHFSGGSRFDREFLIRVDDMALPTVEDLLRKQGWNQLT